MNNLIQYLFYITADNFLLNPSNLVLFKVTSKINNYVFQYFCTRKTVLIKE